MTTITRRASLLLSAFSATLLLTTASISGAQDAQGIHITPNGFRTPLFGMSATTDGSGVTVACAPISAPQVEAARFGRQVSRKMAESSPRATVTTPNGGATFEVTYIDAEGAGFNEGAQGAIRRRAFETALGVWSKAIKAEQLIRVSASMNDIADGDNDPNTILLALAGPSEFWLIDNKAVPSPLAWQQLGGRVDNAGPFDITVNVHSRAEWDYSLDGKLTTGKHSFVFTLLHELAHGLGFVDSFDIKSGKPLNDPFPFPYDLFVNRGSSSRNQLLNHTPEETIRDMKSRDLFFNGDATSELSRSISSSTPMAKLYAPEVHRPSSSISHFDQDTYAPFGTIVMTPVLVVATDKLDGLTLSVMRDLGYQLMPPPTETSASEPTRKQ
jgi:hypothetical protein